MPIKKRTSSIDNKLAIENLADELADRPYGEQKKDISITRTTISLPSSILFQLEDMAKINKRKKDNFRSVSSIIRYCIEKTLDLK